MAKLEARSGTSAPARPIRHDAFGATGDALLPAWGAMRSDGIDSSHPLYDARLSGPTLTPDELRRLVREWVEELKESELPPEKVLVTVKTLVKETIVPRFARYADATDDTDGQIAFVRDASKWCIEALFESTSGGR